jgi:hypothetical protein
MTTLNENDLKKFKRWLKVLLKTDKVTVTFTKKDGSDRVMRCTTNPTYIMFKDPATLEAKKERKANEDVIPVFDLEADAWRSFRWDSIKSVSFTLGS